MASTSDSVGSLPTEPSVRSFLGPPRRYRKRLENHTLGKRDRQYRHAPCLRDTQHAKKPRISECGHAKPDTDLLGETNSEQQPDVEQKPWHRNDRWTRQFNQAELQMYTEPSIPLQFNDPTAYGNDGCPIHPLFTPLALLGNEIPLILPSLRLATRFLFSRHTLPFFHNLMTTAPALLQPESSYYNAPLLHLPISPHQTTGLPEALRMLTMQTLLALASHITIRITPDPRLATRWAYTERLIPPQIPSKSKYRTLRKPYPMPADLPHANHGPLDDRQTHLKSLSFLGTNALINLSPSFIRVLHPFSSSPTQPQRLRAMYFLSLTLLHELAHAVWITRVPVPPAPLIEYEPFYSHQRKSELGHALETTIFGGGKILSLAQDPNFAIGLAWQRWPDADDFYVAGRDHEVVPLARLVRSTTSNKPFYYGGGGLEPCTGPRWETQYVIDYDWIKKQFFAEFWDQFDDEGGFKSGLLNVEKEMGSRCDNYNFDFWLPGDGLDSGCSSYGRAGDSEGVVRPDQEWIDNETMEVEDEQMSS